MDHVNGRKTENCFEKNYRNTEDTLEVRNSNLNVHLGNGTRRHNLHFKIPNFVGKKRQSTEHTVVKGKGLYCISKSNC